jgi:hypothetical protein
MLSFVRRGFVPSSLRGFREASTRTVNPAFGKRAFATNPSKWEPNWKELGCTPEDKEYWERVSATVNGDLSKLTEEQRAKFHFDGYLNYYFAKPGFFQTYEIAPGIKFWEYKKLMKPATGDHYLFDFVVDSEKKYKFYYFKGWWGDLKDLLKHLPDMTVKECKEGLSWMLKTLLIFGTLGILVGRRDLRTPSHWEKYDTLKGIPLELEEEEDVVDEHH